MPNNSDSSKTYELVARAIRFLQANADRQPTLDDLAHNMGLSAFHVQRVFSEWAGISPKRFLQFLTKERAKKLLLESQDILGTTVESGLSGPGRLHDLMVSCEAVTPGQLGALGEGLSIRFGFTATPLGEVIAGITPRGICHLKFIDDELKLDSENELRAEWPNADFNRDDPAVENLAMRIFGDFNQTKPLSVLLKGTNFQIKVWEALLKVPFGSVISYSKLATLAHAPKAQRAIGTALAANRIAVLIPCHRVIRESGETGQYRWSRERKTALLAWEQARIADAED